MISKLLSKIRSYFRQQEDFFIGGICNVSNVKMIQTSSILCGTYYIVMFDHGDKEYATMKFKTKSLTFFDKTEALMLCSYLSKPRTMMEFFSISSCSLDEEIKNKFIGMI